MPLIDGGPLAARALACRRGQRWLFKGLNLQLDPGSITWLRGTNGSGKTSLLRILAGLSAPSEGQVFWGDQATSTTAGAQAARRGVLYLGHANALNDDLSLTEALVFLARLQGSASAPPDATGQARAALSRLGLASRRDALVRTLSQGQRRRGALARLALDEAPRTWLLDEPFDALDTASVDALARQIEAHAARGGAVLLTSHQNVTLAGACDWDLEPWRVSP